jgi:hypothetical protein
MSDRTPGPGHRVWDATAAMRMVSLGGLISPFATLVSMAESDRRSSAGEAAAPQQHPLVDADEEEEEEELAEAYWGDEIVMKCGNWKSVTPAATVKGAAAIVVRDPKTFLLFKDFEVSWRGKDAVSVYVSWEKPKKRVCVHVPWPG